MAISGFPQNQNQGTGSGFEYGGEWDAIPTESSRIAEFNLLDNCTLSSNQIAVISGLNFGATATNLSHNQNMSTGHKFRIIVPDTTSGFFFVAIHTSFLNPYAAINDETATVRGIGLMSGTPVVLSRDNATFATYPIPAIINIGDVLRVEYRTDNSSVYFYNETQADELLYQDVGVGDFVNVLENLSIFGGNVGSTLSFDFTDDYPIYQALFDFEYPESFSKTYYVSNANENSIINNKLLKVGDFVNFYEDEGIKCLISRLVSDEDIVTGVADTLENMPSNVQYALNQYLEQWLITQVTSDSVAIQELKLAVSNAAVQQVETDLLDVNTSLFANLSQFIEESANGTNGNAAIQTAIESNINNYANNIGVGGTTTAYSTVDEAIQDALNP